MIRKQIILVDDDPVILKLQARVVEKILGFSPVQFSNGLDALTYIKSANIGESGLLVLLDINMPEMSGWDVLSEIEKIPMNEKIKVALVTSSVDEYDKRKAARYINIVDFIEKPFRPNAIERLKQNPELALFICVLFPTVFI